MATSAATITGRVVGPDGLGRMGRVTFVPAAPTLQTQDLAVLTGQASFRIDPDGYLVGQAGRSALILPGDYEIDLNIPGDSGIHIRRRVLLSPGQEITLADLLTPVPAPAPPGPVPQPPQPHPIPQPPAEGVLTPGSHDVRRRGLDSLETANPAEIVDLGNGVLTWRTVVEGLIGPGDRGVRDSAIPGILEAMDSAEVIDLGDGSLSWR